MPLDGWWQRGMLSHALQDKPGGCEDGHLVYTDDPTRVVMPKEVIQEIKWLHSLIKDQESRLMKRRIGLLADSLLRR